MKKIFMFLLAGCLLCTLLTGCTLPTFSELMGMEETQAETTFDYEKKLDELGWQIDAVFTHTCPYRYIPREAFMSCVDQSTVDNSTELWLDTIERKLNYNAWYCGHWHIDKRIDKMHFLFESVEATPKTIF